jgi:hypothetical protein
MLPLDVTVLQQPVLSLDMSVLHQPVLQSQQPLDVSVLQAACAAFEHVMAYTSLCCSLSCRWTCLSYKQPVLPLDMPAVHQPVLQSQQPLDESVLQ